MKKLLVMVLGLASFCALGAEQRRFELLENTRSKISFLPLSSDDKYAIIRHAGILFSKVYVNLEHKKNIYKVDPINALKTIEDRYTEMTEEQFHSAMLAVFASVRDYHVNYGLPKPHGCYSIVLPLVFKKSSDGKIIVTSVQLGPKDQAPDIVKVEAGDELISYDKLPATEALKLREKTSSASTPDARSFQSIYDLYWRDLSANLKPAQNNVSLELKHANGEVYSISVPWFSRVYDSCLMPKEELAQNNSGKAPGDPFEQRLKERRLYFQNIRKKFFTLIKNKLNFKKYMSAQKNEVVDLKDLNATKNPSLFWKKINFHQKNIGYLKLNGFEVPDNDLKKAVNEISSVLTDQLNETSSLIIDLRENYGGQIPLAEKMAAMLTPLPMKSMPFFVRANDLTLALFDDEASWKDIIFPRMESNEITGPGVITSQADLTRSSQVYFGKVVLLTNSECFSSCDIFAATMKDNARITIYGTDHSTFGGGANVWALADMKRIFQKLNIPETLPQNINMRVTGRHAHRLINKTLIEDTGVVTDIYLPESSEDLLNAEGSSVVARICKDLVKVPDLKNSSQTFIKFETTLLLKHGNEELTVNATTSNLDQVAVYLNNKFINRFDVSNNSLKFNLPMSGMDYGSYDYQFFGFNKSGPTRFPVLRKSIKAEALADYKKTNKISAVDNAIITNSANDKNCGWKKSGNDFVIEAQYCPELKMDLNESVELTSAEPVLAFDLDLDAEPDYDFFEVILIHNGVEEKLMAPTSTPTSGHFEYTLTKYAGKKVDIKLRLNSDEAGAGKGVVVTHLEIR